MAKVGFFIQEKKVNKHGFTAIKAVVTINYKNVSKSVANVKPKHWNNTKQRVKKPRADEEYNNHEEINSILEKFQTNTARYISNLHDKGTELTPEIIKEFFNGDVLLNNKKDIWEAWSEYLDAAKLSKAAKTIKDQHSTKNYFKKFESETRTKVAFENMNLGFFDRFKEYVLETRSQHYNYLATLTRRLKAFLNWSFDRGYYTGTEHHRFKITEKPGTVVTLSIDEFQRFYNHEFKSKRLEKVRDIFCFGCLTGLRISDLKRLNRENIQNGTIVTYMKKVKKDKPLQIPILPQAQRILNKYQEQYFLLPKISEQKFNSYIKEAAKEAEINTPVKIMHFKSGLGTETTMTKDELIHAHMTRKTFISLAYKAGLDIESIKAITGIKSERTLQRYLTIEADTLNQKIKAFAEMIGEEVITS